MNSAVIFWQGAKNESLEKWLKPPGRRFWRLGSYTLPLEGSSMTSLTSLEVKMSKIFSSFHFVFGKKQNKNKAWSQGDLPLQQYVCTARLSKLDSEAVIFYSAYQNIMPKTLHV